MFEEILKNPPLINELRISIVLKMRFSYDDITNFLNVLYFHLSKSKKDINEKKLTALFQAASIQKKPTNFFDMFFLNDICISTLSNFKQLLSLYSVEEFISVFLTATNKAKESAPLNKQRVHVTKLTSVKNKTFDDGVENHAPFNKKRKFSREQKIFSTVFSETNEHLFSLLEDKSLFEADDHSVYSDSTEVNIISPTSSTSSEDGYFSPLNEVIPEKSTKGVLNKELFSVILKNTFIADDLHKVMTFFYNFFLEEKDNISLVQMRTVFRQLNITTSSAHFFDQFYFDTKKIKSYNNFKHLLTVYPPLEFISIFIEKIKTAQRTPFSFACKVKPQVTCEPFPNPLLPKQTPWSIIWASSVSPPRIKETFFYSGQNNSLAENSKIDPSKEKVVTSLPDTKAGKNFP